MPRPLVALVGRPNVGKSALFNRIVGRRQAIVEDVPGTTRDRIYAESDWNGVEFAIVDTGGLEIVPDSGVEANWQPLAVSSAPYVRSMKAQVEIAIEEADVIVLVVDVVDGLTGTDQAIADMLRRVDKPIVIAANKADNLKLGQLATEFYALGLGDPIPVSALHGTGTGDLLDLIVSYLEETEAKEKGADDRIHLAIVGRPNVGKSSLLNNILGEERAIVSDIAGTTRDAIDMEVELQGRQVVLIDTAGIRRRGRIERGIEKYSVLRALRALERADVAILVLDATQVATAQDLHIAGYILEAKKSVVVAVNKWDLIPASQTVEEEYLRKLRYEFRFMDYVPIHFVSAKTGRGVAKLLASALEAYEERHQRLPTAQLNRLIRSATTKANPPSKGGKRLRVYYATQADIDPPTFILFVNDRRLVHFGFQRFIENRIREEYPFTGTPIQIEFRNHDEKQE